jgi:hypothetical protein
LKHEKAINGSNLIENARFYGLSEEEGIQKKGNPSRTKTSLINAPKKRVEIRGNNSKISKNAFSPYCEKKS